ncbi:hypothetical protein DPEC_G00019000 [Dallia pectoralis]|uniref:Uncharacterized protein n=1 Tax=Dallia pectoralis TaxID=75939 RepID=A0ACC2HGZ9_DALPE|nr:hypothetical protein DPEC_G00019000 [Dallia pectoralis]
MKEDNDNLRKDINALRQEMGHKLDKLTEELRGLTERMEEAENQVERVEDFTLDLTEVLTESIKRQRSIQNKLTDLEYRSRRNYIRLFGVGEGEEGKSVTQFLTNLFKRAYESIGRVVWEHTAAHMKAGMELRKRGLEVEVPAVVTEEVVMETRLQKSLGWERGARPRREHRVPTAQRAKDRLIEFQRGGK